MRLISVRTCAKVLDGHKVNTNVRAIDVGGASEVVLDNKPDVRNPLFGLSRDLIFLDAGFLRATEKPVDFLVFPQIRDLYRKFGMVYCFDTLEHVRNPFKWARHLKYICSRGGYIYLSTVFSFSYHPSPKDFWRFSPDGLRVLFDTAGLNILEAGWENPQKKIGVYILARNE